MRLLALVAGLALIGAACSSGPSRAEVLGDLAESHIVPAYERLEADAAALVDSVDGLCTGLDSASLAGAQEAMVRVRAAWKRAEAMWVGPVMERRSWAVIDWPISSDQIEELLADPETEFTVDYLGRRIGADQRGLGAVEYVIAGEPDRVLAGLNRDRCDYLVGVARVLYEEVRLLPSDWTESWEGGPPYREVFASPEEGGLDRIVNDVLFLLERMTDVEIGTALGVMSREADLDAIVEGPAALGVDDVLGRLAGIEVVLVGAGETSGLSPLLGNALTDRLVEEVARARTAFTAIEGPLQGAVVENSAAIGAARDALKAIQVTVQTEVVSRLGVTIGFRDTDGDTG